MADVKTTARSIDGINRIWNLPMQDSGQTDNTDKADYIPGLQDWPFEKISRENGH
jgi:hypothetical protein